MPRYGCFFKKVGGLLCLWRSASVVGCVGGVAVVVAGGGVAGVVAAVVVNVAVAAVVVEVYGVFVL